MRGGDSEIRERSPDRRIAAVAPVLEAERTQACILFSHVRERGKRCVSRSALKVAADQSALFSIYGPRTSRTRMTTRRGRRRNAQILVIRANGDRQQEGKMTCNELAS